MLYYLPVGELSPPKGDWKYNMYNDRNGGGYDRAPREMHDAVCAECKQQTQVPFKPSEDRPVYCRDCYAKRRPARY